MQRLKNSRSFFCFHVNNLEQASWWAVCSKHSFRIQGIQADDGSMTFNLWLIRVLRIAIPAIWGGEEWVVVHAGVHKQAFMVRSGSGSHHFHQRSIGESLVLWTYLAPKGARN